MLELASQGYDLKEVWGAGRPTDLTEYPINPEDVAEIKYQYEASGIPKAFYTPEQWHQLEYGLEQRLDFKVFAKPAYSAEQMEALQCALVAESRGYVSRDDIIQISDLAMTLDVMKKTLYEAFKEH